MLGGLCGRLGGMFGMRGVGCVHFVSMKVEINLCVFFDALGLVMVC